MTQIIAAYGTLRPGYGNNRLLQGCKHLGIGKTTNKFAMYGSNIPFVRKSEQKDNITVDVFEVPDARVGSIDMLEGHPGWYKREKTEVQLENGNKVEAWLYFNEGGREYIQGGDYTTYRTPDLQSV